MRTDIAAGAVFPDCELTDHTGKHRKFSDLQGPDPMILALSELVSVQKIVGRQKVEFQREMEVGYCRLITISTDNLATTNEYRTGVGVDWTFLSDVGPKVQKDLEIAEYGDPTDDPMIPHEKDRFYPYSRS